MTDQITIKLEIEVNYDSLRDLGSGAVLLMQDAVRCKTDAAHLILSQAARLIMHERAQLRKQEDTNDRSNVCSGT